MSAKYVPIEVTNEQLSDAAYLQSKGFDIAIDDSQLDTHTWYIDDGGMLTNKYLPNYDFLPISYENDNLTAVVNCNKIFLGMGGKFT